jgi:hypothetical protein
MTGIGNDWTDTNKFLSKKLFQQEQYFPKKVRIFNVKVANFIVRVSIFIVPPTIAKISKIA